MGVLSQRKCYTHEAQAWSSGPPLGRPEQQQAANETFLAADNYRVHINLDSVLHLNKDNLICTIMYCNPYSVDATAFPFLYVSALVTGYLFCNWTRRYSVQALEETIDNLEWDLSVANEKLERANERIQTAIKRLSPVESAASSDDE